MKILQFKLAFYITILLLTSCEKEKEVKSDNLSNVNRGSIKIYCYDYDPFSSTEVPLKDVEVSLHASYNEAFDNLLPIDVKLSEADGRCDFHGIETGKYYIRAAKEDYETQIDSQKVNTNTKYTIPLGF